MEWCATEFIISVAHVLVCHRMLIFAAKILWSTTHAPQNTIIGAPQMRFSLLAYKGAKDRPAWTTKDFQKARTSLT
jgi:hypothetical protein